VKHFRYSAAHALIGFVAGIMCCGSSRGCLTVLLNEHKWWRLRGVAEQINLKIFHSQAPTTHVVLLCDSQGAPMLLVVPPTRRWEVGSLFIKLHRRSPWPVGLQIGSWLFTLAGLISCMRCVHQNCKHGTVWTQLTWLWTYSSSSHSIAMVLNIDADKMQGSKIGLGLFPSRPRSNAAFVGRFSSPYRAGPSKNETCRRLL